MTVDERIKIAVFHEVRNHMPGTSIESCENIARSVTMRVGAGVDRMTIDEWKAAHK